VDWTFAVQAQSKPPRTVGRRDRLEVEAAKPIVGAVGDKEAACAARSATGVERARDGGDLEVVAATGAVVHGDVGAGEGMCEERADRVDRHGQ